MALAKWLLFALAGYGVIVAVLYLAQRQFLYHPHGARVSPAAAGLAVAEEVVLPTSDGEQVIAWHVKPRPGKSVVIFFHGNADALARRVSRFAQLTADGTGLVALSFRGYGGSTGRPTEDGLHRDAAAAYSFAAARYPAERIVVWGFSLGSGPAVALAVERPLARLVLESPFTSVVDIAASVFPFVPVRMLMKDQYRSDQRISRLTVPLLVMHGGHDQVVPLGLCERLYALAPEPKRFVLFPEGRHENLDEYGALSAVRQFIYDNDE
ncbi:MAG: alpha/beta fold hydrolase [Xanthobacteraceae bacterium]